MREKDEKTEGKEGGTRREGKNWKREGGEGKEERRGEDKGTNKTLLATVYYARASGVCYESPTIVEYFSLE